MTQGPFFWCLRHNRVEGTEGDPNDRRMGPYATREEAENALATAKANTERWDEEDRRWNEGE